MNAKKVVFADDFSVAGNLNSIKDLNFFSNSRVNITAEE